MAPSTSVIIDARAAEVFLGIKGLQLQGFRAERLGQSTARVVFRLLIVAVLSPPVVLNSGFLAI